MKVKEDESCQQVAIHSVVCCGGPLSSFLGASGLCSIPAGPGASQVMLILVTDGITGSVSDVEAGLSCKVREGDGTGLCGVSLISLGRPCAWPPGRFARVTLMLPSGCDCWKN